MIDFNEFLAAIGRPEPYSWQRRFAARCAAGTPPAVIAVPTGAGKTTAVDALVWALACQAELPAGQRTVGARIVWAIDRRILVDEVHAHAQDLAARLAEAESGPLREIADRLRALGGDDTPLVATRWRGGIATERDLYGPLQPQVITSTVAQIASRLLFRGFGVADAGQALAAGLAACDTTICLDEAHLVEPFRQTVESVRAQRRMEGGVSASLPGLGLITVTATPHHDADERGVIALDEEDWANDELRRRLTARKSATLVELEGTTDREQVGALVEATLAHVRDGADAVACVVNSVRRARDVHQQLRVALPKLDDPPELGLLIGPQRPADRAEFLNAHGPKLFGRGDGKRIVCVATQTFEVGLDADVEAMVTESASATALIQRLGRLNRRGGSEGKATILRDGESWLYRADEGAAWDWLAARARGDTVDVSVAALADGTEPPRPGHRPQAPELTETIVDALSCRGSSLGNWQDVAVEAFWRPGGERRADVSVCWRADLRPELTDAAADAYRAMLLELVPPRPEELLTLTINGARAILATLDAGAGKAGAGARLALAEADVEGETPAARLPEPVVRANGVPFFALRGDELLNGALEGGGGDEAVLRPAEIRPGDVIVLSARLGPQHAAEVFPRTDVAGDVRPAAGAAPSPVRITPEALRVSHPANRLTELTWRHVARVCTPIERQLSDTREASRRATIVTNLVASLRHALPEHDGLARLEAVTSDPAWRIAFKRLELDRAGQPAFDPGDDDLDVMHDDHETAASADEREVDAGEEQPDLPVRAGRKLTDPTALGRDVEPVWVLVPIPVGDREALRDRAGAPPTIDAHGRAVRAQLERYLARLALPEATRAALLVAAAVHDHGKADPRMQAFFRRGVDDFGAKPIAKSTFGTHNPSMDRIARRLSGLPQRWRHEGRSCAVLADARASGAIAINGIPLDGLDWPLSFDSVAGHHGVGFPLPPVAADGAPARRFHVDAADVSGSASGEDSDGWADGASLSHALEVRARYGAWGAAYLEGLLMLADRVVSRRGE